MSDVEQYNELWLERIKSNIEGLKFGTVQITIHEGRIVQIDRTERSRFDSHENNGSQARQKPRQKSI